MIGLSGRASACVLIGAMLLSGVTWGASARAELRITEVVVNGTGGGELDEWIELTNIGAEAVDLSAFRIGDEESPGGGEGCYAFPSATIAPGEVIIVARDAVAFAATFDVPAGTAIFASAGAAAGFALTKDTALATGEIGLSNGSSTTGDEVLLIERIAEGQYILRDGLAYGGTGAVTSYTPPGGAMAVFIDARVTALTDELGSYARVSAVVDTDGADDWEVRAEATPGLVPLNICGDGALQAGEECDDGDTDPDDGCDASCRIECGFSCSGAGPGACAEDCGDGDVAGLEECDDGNGLPGDGCDAGCRVELGFVCDEPEPLCDGVLGTRSDCLLDPCLLPLRITEVHADGLIDSDSEWIELTNLGAIPVDLGRWSFGDQVTPGATAEGSIRFDDGLVLAAGDTLVLAHSGSVFRSQFAVFSDYEFGVDSGLAVPYLHRASDFSPNTNIQLDNSSDQVVLSCGGAVRDVVRWGPGDALTVPAPTGDYAAATPNKGPLTFERLGGAASGTAADWSVSRCPSPGVSPNPNGAPEAAPSLALAPAGVAVTLSLAAFDPDGDPLTFALDKTGTQGTVEDLGAGLVRYTPPAGPGPLTTSFAFTASDACSTSTPARVELRVGTASCDRNLDDLRVTEVHVDARVDNDGEWIELANTGPATIDLGFLRVGDEESEGGSEGMVIFPPGTTLAPGDALVLAFSATTFRADWDVFADREWYRDSDGLANDLPRASAWGAGPVRLDNSDDGVLLVGCDGAVIDALYWGRETVSGTPAEPPWVEHLRPTPTWDGLSDAGPTTFSRRDPDVDTNGPADWYVEACPTPGRARSDNDAPIAEDAAYALALGQSLSRTFGASDADSGALTFTASAEAGTVVVTDPATGAFTFAPPAGMSGYFEIDFAASDGCASGAGTVRVCVAQDPASCDLECAPGRPELCDGKDNDCSAATPDGSGDPTIGAACDSPADPDLCPDEVRTCAAGTPSCPNDTTGDSARLEACDADDTDEDCDGAADDLDPQGATGKRTFYRDIDGDGRGRTGTTQSRCDTGDGWVPDGGDCDDDPGRCGARCSPALIESRALGNCGDRRDNDCDGTTDLGPGCFDDILCYLDRDGDGFGRFSSEIVVTGPAADLGCAGYLDGVNPAGTWVANGLDCDDEPTACGARCHPEAADLCDGDDNDCDPNSADGAGDPRVDAPCDAAADTDLCLDDRGLCQGGTVECVNVAATDLLQVEVCDGARKDEDCDGGADDADPQGAPANAPVWYRDADGDAFGTPAEAVRRCVAPAGFVDNALDCADQLGGCGAACNPERVEVCDGLDNDCDEATADGDGDLAIGVDCDSPADADFCLDERTVCAQAKVACANDPEGDPLRVEVCDDDDVDEDCDGGADDLDPDGAPSGVTAFFADRDGDGWGDAAAAVSACDPPSGHVREAGDCDDEGACGASCNPGVSETAAAGLCADGLDNDCDGSTDTGPGCNEGSLCYADTDGDGHGDDATSAPLPAGVASCASWGDGAHGVGYWVAEGGDCADDSPGTHPGAIEVVGNDVDEDCSGTLRCWVDGDNDNFALETAAEGDAPAGEDCEQAFMLAPRTGDCEDDLDGCGPACSPVAVEICDGLDNDCDLATDDGACDDQRSGIVGGGEGCASGGAEQLAALGLVMFAVRSLARRRGRARAGGHGGPPLRLHAELGSQRPERACQASQGRSSSSRRG